MQGSDGTGLPSREAISGPVLACAGAVEGKGRAVNAGGAVGAVDSPRRPRLPSDGPQPCRLP